MPEVRQFQLDECINSRDLAAMCNAAGGCIVHRYPNEMISKKDYEMLPIILSRTATLLTIDRKIVEENSDYIPDINSGIVVVKTTSTTTPLTTKIAAQIIETLKSRLPGWNSADLSNAYIEIDESQIYIGRLTKESFSTGSVVRIDEENFPTKFYEKLDSISS
jgi:hypothetical protein